MAACLRKYITLRWTCIYKPNYHNVTFFGKLSSLALFPTVAKRFLQFYRSRTRIFNQIIRVIEFYSIAGLNFSVQACIWEHLLNYCSWWFPARRHKVLLRVVTTGSSKTKDKPLCPKAHEKKKIKQSTTRSCDYGLGATRREAPRMLWQLNYSEKGWKQFKLMRSDSNYDANLEPIDAKYFQTKIRLHRGACPRCMANLHFIVILLITQHIRVCTTIIVKYLLVCLKWPEPTQ